MRAICVSLLLVPVLVTAPAFSADVTSFTLIDADADVPIAAHDPLMDGVVLDLETLPSRNLSVRANVDGAVGSVSFDLSGAETHSQTESVAPYALFGDSDGDFDAWTPQTGTYQLAARSHDQAGGGGVAGTDLVVGFSVVDGQGVPPDGDGSVVLRGTREQWHAVIIEMSGPGARETSDPNPFLDRRMNVLFTGPSGQAFDVPGFFAGDGTGDGIGAGTGNRWQAWLSPDEVGSWSYLVSFRAGDDVAIDLSGTEGVAVAPYDGVSGTFDVAASSADDSDFRAPARGLLKNRGGHYLTDGDGDPWLKVGPDIPENFLGYTGFDNTPDAGHVYAAHVGDWRPGDPEWANGAGRGIVGALNYIADRGANTIYFLPMNLGGDGRDTFPTISETAKTRYDLSKLAQWVQVLDHAQSRGIFLHVVLAETEAGNENYHDGGALGPERKLFYRMLAARFGHLNGLEWNLGEENDYGAEKHRAFAAYLKAVDAYDHPLTTHTRTNQFDAYYEPLLGNGDFDMTSFQATGSRATMFDLVLEWRDRSAASGVPWAVSLDEPQRIENDPLDLQSGYPHGRRDKMWPTLMAGGAGFEWYVQEDGGGHSFDQRIDDFGLMETALVWSGHVRTFLESLPLDAMVSNRDLAQSSAGGNAYVRFLTGSTYALYNDRNGSDWSLDLLAEPADARFRVRWFDPRQGVFLDGAVAEVSGGATVSLGSAPQSTDTDWACLLVRLDAPLFADGFESGDLSAWSASLP